MQIGEQVVRFGRLAKRIAGCGAWPRRWARRLSIQSVERRAAETPEPVEVDHPDGGLRRIRRRECQDLLRGAWRDPRRRDDCKSCLAAVGGSTRLEAGLGPEWHEPVSARIRRGFDLDEAKIQKSSHVLDFEGFKELAVLGSSGATAGLPAAPKGTAAQVRQALMTSPHVDRPALAVAVVKEALEAEIAKGADESQARTRVVPFLTEALGGLHIINTSRKDFREGRLPQHLNESSDLHIDASLAEHLVRLVKVGS